MNGTEMIKRLRRMLDDYVEPYYVPDSTLYNLLSEAEVMFAQTTKVLRDEVTFSTQENIPWYDLADSGRILEFRRAYMVLPSGYKIQLKLNGTMDQSFSQKSDYGALLNLGDSSSTSRPVELRFGLSTNLVKLIPTPDAEYTIIGDVTLLPEFPIDSKTSVPQVPEQYHSMVVMGAALLAVENFPDLDEKNKLLERFDQAWSRSLAQVKSEVGGISRDAGTVDFVNDYW